MKQTILLFLVMFSVHCFGQKWYLNRINENAEYPYEYYFSFQHLDDSCSYELIKKSGVQNSTIQLYDSEGKIAVTTIKIQNIETDSIITLPHSFEGLSNIRLPKGKYKLQTSRGMLYEPFDMEFEIEDEQYIELTI